MNCITSLDDVVQIGQSSYQLVLDRISVTEGNDDLFVAMATEHHERLVVASSSVLELKNKSQLPIIGLLSLLFANDVFDESKAFQIMNFDSGMGLYVLFEGGRAVDSGLFTGAFIPAHPELDIQSAHVIRPDLSDLKVVPEIILTREERLSKFQGHEKSRNKQRLYVLMGITCFGLLLAHLGNYVSSKSNKETDSINTVVNELKMQLRNEQAKRGFSLTKTPELDELIWLINKDDKLTSTDEIIFNGQGFTVISRLGSLVDKEYSKVDRADGRFELTWRPQ